MLPNGKVLATGGCCTPSSAELYDPALGTWTATGSLTTGRFGHTATLLPNGKVLVAGGSANGLTSSAELYEPTTGTWTTTGSLATARTLHTATLLSNGQVLVAGGFGPNGPVSSAELYDPTAGTWTTTGSLTVARGSYTATLLPNGKVLAAGGFYAVGLSYQPLPSAELYNPATKTWTATGSLATGRESHTATLLPNGKVLVAAGNGQGGGIGPPSIASAEVYDPALGTWSATGSLATPRSRHTATLLPSGNVLAAGGCAGSGCPNAAPATASAEVYLVGSGTWSATGSMATTRESHTATLLPNSSVLVAGGIGAGGYLSSAELYELLPVADLSIAKTDGQTTSSPGQTITYTITGTNAGPTAANGATVADTVPATLTGAAWTCVAAGGATCTAGPLSGNINDTVNLPAGGTVTYTLTGQVAANAKGLSNTATITLPPLMFDPNTADNTANDTDLLICNGEQVVVPDGRLTTSMIGAGAIRWFGAGLKIGDSYSLEFKNAQVDTPVSNVAPGTLTVYSGDDGCSGTSTVAVTDTTPSDPSGSGASVRVSFTASGVSPFFRSTLMNGSSNPILYSVGWSDTTLYSPTWSTNASFDTYYSVANTTGTTLSGVLILFDKAGSVVGSSHMTIPAGQKGSANTAALGITRNRTGTAQFTHNGPPGAATIEAAVASFSLATPYVQPVKFETVREAR